MTKIVVLTGAGISAESGLKTFRATDGLWEEHRVEDVATPEAWYRDPELVQRFYNERRKQVIQANPNAGHQALAELETKFEVTIVTQNIDDLHERAGSKHVIHLHGEILKARSSVDETLLYDWRDDIRMGDLCERGSQLRPHVVWFGEPVPMIETASRFCRDADIFIIVGTSLAVYPAAGLVHYVNYGVPKYIVDPNIPGLTSLPNAVIIQQRASEGLPPLAQRLLSQVGQG